jgi:hypothetical protein
LLALLIFIGGTLFGVALMALAPALRTLALPQVGQAPVNTAAQGTPLLSLPVAKDVTLLSIHDLVAGTLYVQTGDASTVTLSASTSAAPSVQSSQQGDTLTLSLAGQVSDDFTLVLPPQVSLDLQTTSAAIVFTGTLLPQNTYQFASETGSISLSLPANSAFRLGNIVDVGDFTNDFGTDVVGSGPRSTLIILAYDGSVAIQKH